MKHNSPDLMAGVTSEPPGPASPPADDAPARVDELRRTWERHGRNDPFWAVLTDPQKRHGGWSLEEFFATGQIEIAELMALLDRLHVEARESALDFGCGIGRLAEALSEYYGVVVGVDISDEMVTRARELSRSEERVRYEANARADLATFGNDEFDLVHSSRVLQHVAPTLMRRYLNEFCRVLRPGGVLHFQLPTTPKLNAPGIALRLLPELVSNRLRGGMQMHGVDERIVTRYLERLGFDVLDVRPDDGAGPRWNSRRYTARKRSR
jgi:SAM-dependent methyltransferase